MINKDTDMSILMRFHVKKRSYKHFTASFAQIIKHDNPLEILQGVNYDADEMLLIYAIPVKSDLSETMDELFNIMLRLYDYYPSLSEKPFETDVENAVEFKKQLTPKRKLAYA